MFLLNPKRRTPPCPPGHVYYCQPTGGGQWVCSCKPIEDPQMRAGGSPPGGHGMTWGKTEVYARNPMCPPGHVQHRTADGRTICRAIGNGGMTQGGQCPPGTVRYVTPSGETICEPIGGRRGMESGGRRCPPGTVRYVTADGNTICQPINGDDRGVQGQPGALPPCPPGHYRVCRMINGVQVCECKPIAAAKGLTTSPRDTDMGFPSRRRAKRMAARMNPAMRRGESPTRVTPGAVCAEMNCEPPDVCNCTVDTDQFVCWCGPVLTSGEPLDFSRTQFGMKDMGFPSRRRAKRMAARMNPARRARGGRQAAQSGYYPFASSCLPGQVRCGDYNELCCWQT